MNGRSISDALFTLPARYVLTPLLLWHYGRKDDKNARANAVYAATKRH